jgi:hypothetical protein
MIPSSIKQIIERASTNAAFRELLLTQPDQALAQFSLSVEDLAAFKELPRQVYEKLIGDLSLLDGELTEEMLTDVSGASGCRVSI